MKLTWLVIEKWYYQITNALVSLEFWTSLHHNNQYLLVVFSKYTNDRTRTLRYCIYSDWIYSQRCIVICSTTTLIASQLNRTTTTYRTLGVMQSSVSLLLRGQPKKLKFATALAALQRGKRTDSKYERWPRGSSLLTWGRRRVDRSRRPWLRAGAGWACGADSCCAAWTVSRSRRMRAGAIFHIPRGGAG